MPGSLEDLRDLYKNRGTKTKREHGCYSSSIIEVYNTTSRIDTDLIKTANKFLIHDTEVKYSLNKKKRWQIKDDLIAKIEDLSLENCDVRLYETLETKKSYDLIASYKSKGQNIEEKEKSRRNFRSIRNQENVEAARQRNTPKTPQIKEKKPNRFKTGNIKQKKKKKRENENERIVINMSEDEVDEEVYNGRTEYIIKHKAAQKDVSSPLKDSKTSRRIKCVSLNDIDELLWSESEEEVMSESSEEEIPSHVEFEKRLDEKNLIDFEELVQKFAIYLVEKQKLNELKNAKKISIHTDSKHSDLEPKSHITYIENLTTKAKLFKESKQMLSFCQANPIYIKLDQDTIHTSKLIEQFGTNYNEARHSSPRHFNIDLTQPIKQHLFKTTPSNSYDIFAWLRFQQSGQLFRVSICSNLKCKSISLKKTNREETYTVQDIYTKAVELIQSLPLDSFYQKTHTSEVTINNTDTIADKQLINSFKLISNRQEGVDLANLRNKLFEQQQQHEKVEEVSHELSETCVLCFDENLDLEKCVRLNTCGHSICTNCMRDYVDSRMMNTLRNAGRFPCPCCDKEIDLALMISYASSGVLLETFLRVSIEKVFFNVDNYKWCPSPRCDRILKVDTESNPYGVASCGCGFKMCLMCNQEPHFPAKCSQVSNYHKELQKRGDKNPVEPDNHYISLGKRCPKCQTYMEKNQGCNHMRCSICYFEFCWWCMKSWVDHTTLNECTGNDIYKQVEIEFNGKKKAMKKKIENDFHYSNSLSHRLNRTTKMNDERKQLAKRLLKTLDYKDFSEYVEYEKFLNETVAFLVDLHFICEYGYVSTWGQGNEDSKLRVSYAVKSIELVIFKIMQVLENEKGNGAVERLKVLFNRGIKCLKLLQNI